LGLIDLVTGAGWGIARNAGSILKWFVILFLGICANRMVLKLTRAWARHTYGPDPGPRD